MALRAVCSRIIQLVTYKQMLHIRNTGLFHRPTIPRAPPSNPSTKVHPASLPPMAGPTEDSPGKNPPLPREGVRCRNRQPLTRAVDHSLFEGGPKSPAKAQLKPAAPTMDQSAFELIHGPAKLLSRDDVENTTFSIGRTHHQEGVAAVRVDRFPHTCVDFSWGGKNHQGTEKRGNPCEVSCPGFPTGISMKISQIASASTSSTVAASHWSHNASCDIARPTQQH